MQHGIQGGSDLRSLQVMAVRTGHERNLRTRLHARMIERIRAGGGVWQHECLCRHGEQGSDERQGGGAHGSLAHSSTMGILLIFRSFDRGEQLTLSIYELRSRRAAAARSGARTSTLPHRNLVDQVWSRQYVPYSQHLI
eukprot:6208272-Pleurochrysis_carterae.AAC.5